jgi:F-type H+-transporting ATPase subunit alpha
VNVGISVSRVGGNAQIKAMKEVAGSLRLDLAAFRELEAFAQLGTELDAASQLQLDRGARMVELLKQGQYSPYNVIDQCISMFAGTRGFLDNVDLNLVNEFERGLLDYFNTTAKALRSELAQKGSFKEIGDQVSEAIKDYKASFEASKASFQAST